MDRDLLNNCLSAIAMRMTETGRTRLSEKECFEVIEGVIAMRYPNQDTPIGTPVTVRKDDGKLFETVTRSKPWALGHGQKVILVEGIAGGYMLERVVIKDA
jgi:hypothetical protein